jgi:hypothetical protein
MSASASDEDRVGPTAKPLADPKEHPEQHAALQTGRQSEAQPEGNEEEGLLDHEEHSDAEGPTGTG